MKFTIIIPAYNSTKFINIPLDSLEKQKYEDFEVLIVNDGSTDDLKEVLKPYLNNHQNWKLINKKNGNWGSVINYVISKKLINGDYVTILDSDDYFKEDILDLVKNRNEDIIITGINKLENNKESNMPIYFGNKNRLIKKDRAFAPVSTPHGKFYKKDLFIKMIKLEEGVSYQDTVLFNDLISKSKDIYYISKPLAVWWIDRDGNSTTMDWDETRAELWLKTCERIINLSNANNEVHSWAIFYLWELNRNYKGTIPFKIKVNKKMAKFKWLPFGLRGISKIYFLLKTKKYIIK